MTARTATDKRPVSLTKRQWHLIVDMWASYVVLGIGQQYAEVMTTAAPAIANKCRSVDSEDDIVVVNASLEKWAVVSQFCNGEESLGWSVCVDLVPQLRIDSHGE